jgi:3-hydroxybutyryl-CoA dehydrogenase
MSKKEIRKIAVIGSGKLGTDIFYYLMDFDLELLLICINEEEAEKQNAVLQKKLNRQTKAGIINEAKLKQLQNTLIIDHHFDKLSGRDLIIECIWENKVQKQKVFASITPFVNDSCILASNSSSINPSLLNPSVDFKNRFIGLHYFYPLKFKNIVEIIKTDNTSKDVLDSITAFCQKTGKTFLLQDEFNSFILNKLFLEVQNEAYNIFCEGVLSYRQIDKIVDNSLFPGGIFSFFDQVGNDIMLESIKNYFPKAERAPYSALIAKLEELCSQNLLGIKTNAGFYDYKEFNTAATLLSAETPDTDYVLDVTQRLIQVYVAKAQSIVEGGICSQELLEFAAKEYMNADKGPFSLFTEYSLNKI